MIYSFRMAKKKAKKETNHIMTIDGLDTNEMLQRFSQLKIDRQPFEGRWREIAELVLPRREIKDDFENGRTVGTYIYSTRAKEANRIWGEGLAGNTVAPQQKWFKTKLPFRGLDEDPDVKLWLEFVDTAFYAAINASNFNDIMVEYYKDGGAFGNGYMFAEEVIKDGKIAFTTEHYYKMYVAEDQYGRVDSVYKEFTLTAYQAKDQFGLENLSENIKTNLEANHGDNKYTFVQFIQPRRNRDEKKVDNKNMPFVEGFHEQGTDWFIRESGYRKMPWIVWRVTKQTDEKYGRGPADEAYPNILSANNMAKDTMRISQNNADPPTEIEGEWLGKVRTTPGAKNYKAAANASVKPIITGQRFDVSLQAQEREEAAIDRIFNTEFFLLLSRSEIQKTATEINALQGERAMLLGSIVGGINSQILNPLFDRIFDIEMTAGRIPPPPQIILDNLQGASIEIDFTGPLEQIQKQTLRNRGVNQSLGALIGLAEVFPEVLDRIDPDGLAKEILEVNNAPSTIMFDDEEVAERRAAKAQALKAAQQQQKQQEATKPIDMSKAPEEGSPLQLVNEQQEQAV